MTKSLRVLSCFDEFTEKKNIEIVYIVSDVLQFLSLWQFYDYFDFDVKIVKQGFTITNFKAASVKKSQFFFINSYYIKFYSNYSQK